jgi:carotenoid 1,2-hydratase
MTAAEKILSENFAFSSSLQDDVWHAQSDAKSYEWWYFDALSDDGRDAVVVIFFDNFIFSPRYNSKKESEKVPALAFFYYRNGKPVYRIIKEFSPENFQSSQVEPFVKLENASMKFDCAPYGKGYLIEIKTDFQQNKQLDVKLEWLLIETDFTEKKEPKGTESHNWNLVAPRADVTGHINVTNAKGKAFDNIHFRGSGYHDHNVDSRYLPTTVENWQWGRAHFSDSTAVFYRYKEIGSEEFVTKLYVVRNGELRQRDAEFEEQQFARDIFGIKYPERLRFVSADNMRLRVKQTKVIDSSFFYLRFLSEMTLTLRDGKPRKTMGITECLCPKTLNYRWLDWLIDMRIARDGKSAFLT